jgi:hypothetical protein
MGSTRKRINDVKYSAFVKSNELCIMSKAGDRLSVIGSERFATTNRFSASEWQITSRFDGIRVTCVKQAILLGEQDNAAKLDLHNYEHL